MTPKPPAVSGRKLVKLLSKLGYKKVSQRGSHIKLKNDQTGSVLVIPDHKELDRGTLRAIIRQSGLTVEAFVSYL